MLVNRAVINVRDAGQPRGAAFVVIGNISVAIYHQDGDEIKRPLPRALCNILIVCLHGRGNRGQWTGGGGWGRGGGVNW